MPLLSVYQLNIGGYPPEPANVATSFPLSLGFALRKSITMSAGYGSFTFTGQTAGSIRAYSLSMGYGSFTFTGQDAQFRSGQYMPADYGSFTFTGQAVTLRQDLKLTADYGAVTFTGQNATFVSGASAGSSMDYATSFPLALGAAISHAAATESAAINTSFPLALGLALVAAGPKMLRADGVAFTFTGQAVSLRQALALSAAYGAFTYTGQDVTLTVGAGTPTASFSGTVPFPLAYGFVSNRKGLTAGYGSFTFTGQTATLYRGTTPPSGNTFQTTIPLAAGMQTGLSNAPLPPLSAEYGSFQFSFASSYSDLEMAAASGSFTLSGQDVLLDVDSSNTSANGDTVAATASLLPGSAFGDSATTPIESQTVTAAASVSAGAVWADSQVSGQTLAVLANLSGLGIADNGASVDGQTLTTTVSLSTQGGLSTSHTIAGETPVVTVSLLAGDAGAAYTIDGQTLTVLSNLSSLGEVTASGLVFGVVLGARARFAVINGEEVVDGVGVSGPTVYDVVPIEDMSETVGVARRTYA